jgi:uncharacterized protein
MTAERTDEKTARKRGPKPGTEAAKRGGNAVKAKYGADFFGTMGKKGGAITKTKGPAFFEEIGRKGGKTTSVRHGTDFYRRIGRKGGMNKGRNWASRGEEQGT